MARSRRNYICITESGAVEKYASQSIDQIIEEKQRYEDPFISIISTGFSSFLENEFEGYEKLKWRD